MYRINEIRNSKLKEILSRKNKDTVQFWKEVEEIGSPLIEEYDENHKMVTFVYRCNIDRTDLSLYFSVAETDNVRFDTEANTLQRLSDTDIYHISFKVPKPLRTQYNFIEGPPLKINSMDEGMILPTMLRVDMLNKNRIILMENKEDPSKNAGIAYFELEDAPPQHWIQERNVKRGNLERTVFKSKIMNNEREMWIYTPPNYSKEKKYHLVIFLDGGIYSGVYLEGIVPGPTVFDNLIAEGQIPPVIGIFINPSGVGMAREMEFVNNEEFVRMMGEELYPWITEKFNIHKDPKTHVIGGSSAGANASIFTAITYPQYFGNLLSQSAALWFGKGLNDKDYLWLVSKYVSMQTVKVKFYLEVGIFENFVWFTGPPSLYHANKHFVDVLKLKNNEYKFVEYVGGHDYIIWRNSLAEGLMYLIGK